MVNPVPGTRPAWVDDELFGFESRFRDVAGAAVHYVDEGPRDGPILLMLHGNPTWSFLYRHLIEGLSVRFRCIALDYPGFGLSSAPPGYGFTAAEHADVVEAFVADLDLTGVTPVVQDWGGPIGFTVAVRHPDRFRAFVVGNTWAWPRFDGTTKAFSRIMGGPVGRYLCERHNSFVRRLVPAGHRAATPSPEEMAHWEGPFPDEASRVPTHVFPREILAARPLLHDTASRLGELRDRPALLVWADGDFAFGEADLTRWQETFPTSSTVRLAGAGHYLQDDDPAGVLRAIDAWWPPGRDEPMPSV